MKKSHLALKFSHSSLHLQVMKTYHMYHSESISAESKLKEAEKQEEKQIGRGDQVFSIRMEDKYQRRSSVKKIEKMKEKVCCASVLGDFNHLNCNTDITVLFAQAWVSSFALPAVQNWAVRAARTGGPQSIMWLEAIPCKWLMMSFDIIWKAAWYISIL